jgi:diguanylate cyclase (GGDEF)-like protein
MIDLNDFKAINDGFGHPIGNAALRLFADTLREEIRDGSDVCRYGGDEFVVLLPGTWTHQAHRVADRLRAQVQDCLIPGSTRPLSLSVGVATFPEDGQDAETLFAVADQRMYENKPGRKAAHTPTP